MKVKPRYSLDQRNWWYRAHPLFPFWFAVDFEQTAEDLGFSTDGKTLHFEPHTTYGWTYRLTRKEASVISKKSKYISLMTKTNGTLFTTKTLRGLVSEHKDMQAKYDKKQNALVKEVVAIAGECSVTRAHSLEIGRSDTASALQLPIQECFCP